VLPARTTTGPRDRTIPTENAYTERLIRTLKKEEVYLNDYEDYEDAYHRIGHFLDEVYMTKRVHSALDYLTPTEFEALHVAHSQA